MVVVMVVLASVGDVVVIVIVIDDCKIVVSMWRLQKESYLS